MTAIKNALVSLRDEEHRLDVRLTRVRQAIEALSDVEPAGRRRNATAGLGSTGSKRRRMTAAERKAVSRRMKRYWAKRRKAGSKVA